MDIINIIGFINKNWYSIVFILTFLLLLCDYLKYVYWIGFLKYFNIDKTVLSNNEYKYSKIMYYFSWIVFLVIANIICILVNILFKEVIIVISILVCFILSLVYIYLINRLVKLDSRKKIKKNYKNKWNKNKKEFFFELLTFNVVFNVITYLKLLNLIDLLFLINILSFIFIIKIVFFTLILLFIYLWITFFFTNNGEYDAKYKRVFKFARDVIRKKEYVVVYEDRSSYIVCDYIKHNSKKKLYIYNGKYLTITKNNIEIKTYRFEKIILEVES